MCSRGGRARHHCTAITAVAREASVAAFSSGAICLSIQWQRVARGGGRLCQGLVTSGLASLFVVGSGSSSSRGVFPFSTAENLRIGAMGVATGNGARRKKKRAEQEEMSNGGSASLLIYSRRRPTGDPHDHR